MRDRVNLVVTCTKDKRVPVDPACQIRTLPTGNIELRVEQWADRMKDRQFARVAVRDLYAGDHWNVVRSIESTHFNITTWICSAGHGLVRLTDLVTPYSATFSANHPDAVSRNVNNHAPDTAGSAWWRLLARKVRPPKAGPRTLKTLAQEYPRAALIVVASSVYLDAIEEDLERASYELEDPDHLSIISAGAKSSNRVAEHLVPCDARLQHEVGGARRSLNTRVARHVIHHSRTMPTLPKLKRRLETMLEKQPEITQYDRKPMSDEEVLEFIALQLKTNPHLKHTPLLRKLRDAGYACEQKRFARLYRRVAERPYGRA